MDFLQETLRWPMVVHKGGKIGFDSLTEKEKTSMSRFVFG